LTLLYLVVALIIIVLFAWGLRARSRRQDATHASDNVDTVTGWPPQATRVLTSAERQTYDLLRSALPAHMILAQVPLQRFIKVPTRYSYAEWLRRVGQLNADFVVCDRHSQVVAIVEIQGEDESPNSRSQRRRERMLRVLKSAQIPVHVWRAGALPSVTAAREAIAPDEESAGEAAVAAPASAVRAVPAHSAVAAVNEASGNDVPMREPPPSTWFDDFDSGPTPLAPDKAKPATDTKPRPDR